MFKDSSVENKADIYGEFSTRIFNASEGYERDRDRLRCVLVAILCESVDFFYPRPKRSTNISSGQHYLPYVGPIDEILNRLDGFS